MALIELMLLNNQIGSNHFHFVMAIYLGLGIQEYVGGDGISCELCYSAFGRINTGKIMKMAPGFLA